LKLHMYIIFNVNTSESLDHIHKIKCRKIYIAARVEETQEVRVVTLAIHSCENVV